jgi:hypothetical protein
MARPPVPNIYVIRTEYMHTLGGKTVWMLDYTVNGELQSPRFNSQKAMTDFREHLDTIGKVYQRDLEEK